MECEILFNFELLCNSSIYSSMILGVYWYFKFPEHLYHFKFFRFLPGYGGHADNPAELETKVEVKNTGDILTKLEDLKAQFPRTYLHIHICNNRLVISTGDHMLFDYNFQFAVEIEALLIRENAILLDSQTPLEIQSTKVFRPENQEYETIEHRFIQMTGSDFKRNNAENYSVRIDCNLPLADKSALIEDLAQICKEENINVFYYHDADFNNHCNLMLFFTNGRQEKDSIQKVHINSFGSKVRHLTEKYPLLHFGHLEGFKYYPVHNTHVRLMVDEDYILNEKQNPF